MITVYKRYKLYAVLIFEHVLYLIFLMQHTRIILYAKYFVTDSFLQPWHQDLDNVTNHLLYQKLPGWTLFIVFEDMPIENVPKNVKYNPLRAVFPKRVQQQHGDKWLVSNRNCYSVYVNIHGDFYNGSGRQYQYLYSDCQE